MTYKIHMTPKPSNNAGRAHVRGEYESYQVAMKARRDLLNEGLARYWNAEIIQITD